MTCLEEKDLMNYVLGRDIDQAMRAHIHGCANCRKELARMEDRLLSESLDRENHAFRPISLRRRRDRAS